MIAATITCPLELVRTNLQAHARGTPSSLAQMGIFRTLRRIQRESGVLRLWAGLPPTILRDAPFSAIYWSAYEHMKRHSPFVGYEKNSFLVTFTSGATAGMLAAVLTTPIDVIKTRRQMHVTDSAQVRPHECSFLGSTQLYSFLRRTSLSLFFISVLFRILFLCIAMQSPFKWFIFSTL